MALAVPRSFPSTYHAQRPPPMTKTAVDLDWQTAAEIVQRLDALVDQMARDQPTDHQRTPLDAAPTMTDSGDVCDEVPTTKNDDGDDVLPTVSDVCDRKRASAKTDNRTDAKFICGGVMIRYIN